MQKLYKKILFILFILFIHQKNVFSEQYIQYNVYGQILGNENYQNSLGIESLTLGASNTVFTYRFLSIGVFMDLSFFRFDEIRKVKDIEKSIQELALKLKPKIALQKNSIQNQIQDLQEEFDTKISQGTQLPTDGELSLNRQINNLYKNLISFSNYEKELDQKILAAGDTLETKVTKNEDQRAAIKEFIGSTAGLIENFSSNILAKSNSPYAQKAGAIFSGTSSGKAAAVKEIVKIGANTITDIVFDIKNLEAESEFLEVKSNIAFEKNVIQLQEANLISQIDSIESLNKRDIDSSIYAESLQVLYSKLDNIKKAKQILSQTKLITDTFIRIPFTIGGRLDFNLISWFSIYTEIGLILSMDNSLYKDLNKFRIGARLGTGINFNLFSKRLILGIHVRYWGMLNHFISVGPSIGVQI